MNALKPNHVVQVECFFDDYKKIKRNSKTFWKRFLIISGIISFIFFLSLLENKFDFAFFCEYIQLIILLFIFAYFILKLFDYIWIKTEYEELCDGDTKSIRYKVSFYDDSCELKYKENVKVYEYQNIKKMEDINYCLYIIFDERNIIPIPKEMCTADFITFLRYQVVEKVTNADLKKLDPTAKQNQIRNALLILFILTILCLHMAPYFWGLAIETFNVPYSLMQKYTWICSILAIIPITSAILGKKYKERGFHCKKNIVTGWIIGTFLILCGMPSFVPDLKKYNNIFKYEPIVDVALPKKGTFYRTNIEKNDASNAYANYAIFKDQDENDEFYNAITKNQNWVKEEQLSKNVKNKLVNVFECDVLDTCYYSVYIKELDKYNTFPTETGSYLVYSMLYNPKKNFLMIKEFKYKYY